MHIGKRVNTLLERNGLQFQEIGKETDFFCEFALKQRQFLQVVLLIGGILVYLFSIWDHVIDPQNSNTTQMIRVAVLTPVIWLGVVSMYFKRLDKFFELTILFVSCVTVCGLAVIFAILRGGYNDGTGGFLLIFLFVFALMPLRTNYVIVFSILSLAIVNIGEALSPTTKTGMAVVTNLMVISGLSLGAISSIAKEYWQRKQFTTMMELKDTRAAVGDLQRSNLCLKIANNPQGEPIRQKILISYRRADSEGVTGRIRDRLVRHFGETAIFMDIDSVRFGEDFRKRMILVAGTTDVVLAVIGPKWQGVVGHGRTRIEEEDDPVRVEIETALVANVPIIPVLVSGAKMPTHSELPTSIAELSFRNAISVDNGRDFHPHMDRLVRSVEFIVGESAIPA